MKKTSNMSLNIETKVSQALRFLDEKTGAVIPSIQLSATYARDANYENKMESSAPSNSAIIASA